MGFPTSPFNYYAQLEHRKYRKIRQEEGQKEDIFNSKMKLKQRGVSISLTPHAKKFLLHGNTAEVISLAYNIKKKKRGGAVMAC